MNISCDQEGDGYQLVPVFLNWAKNTLTNDELKKEFADRGFLQTTNKKVLLPPDYDEKSYFDQTYHTAGKSSLAKGRKGQANCQESIDKMKQTKKEQRENGTSIGKNSKLSKPIKMMTLSEPHEVLQTFESLGLAATHVNGRIGNISSAANGRLKTAYKYKWEYV
jgi:hypothetical protein